MQIIKRELEEKILSRMRAGDEIQKPAGKSTWWLGK